MPSLRGGELNYLVEPTDGSAPVQLWLPLERLVPIRVGSVSLGGGNTNDQGSGAIELGSASEPSVSRGWLHLSNVVQRGTAQVVNSQLGVYEANASDVGIESRDYGYWPRTLSVGFVGLHGSCENGRQDFTSGFLWQRAVGFTPDKDLVFPDEHWIPEMVNGVGLSKRSFSTVPVFTSHQFPERFIPSLLGPSQASES